MARNTSDPAVTGSGSADATPIKVSQKTRRKIRFLAGVYGKSQQQCVDDIVEQALENDELAKSLYVRLHGETG